MSTNPPASNTWLSPVVREKVWASWRPDVFVRAYVPQDLLAINRAPARFITSPPIAGIDYTQYCVSFLSQLFSFSNSQVLDPQGQSSKSELRDDSYGARSRDALARDLLAQEPEVRSFDMFEAELSPVPAPTMDEYQFHVPGLREGTPRVAYGDTILLRQLVIDRLTNRPYPQHGHTAAHPGFTGYQISAVVCRVDRSREMVVVRASGVLTASLPLRFNVSFIVQTEAIRCLERAVDDMSRELTRATNRIQSDSNDSAVKQEKAQTGRSWIQSILTPSEEDGQRRTRLPRGAFSQRWVDPKLNYEQMKAVDTIQAQKYGRLPFIINGPPGTGKTKTVVEAVLQLLRDDTFSGAILLCAPSDPAADTLAIRLRAEIARMNPGLLFRLNEFSRTFAEVPEILLPYCHVEGTIFGIPDVPSLMRKRVVVTTCRGADSLVQARLTNRHITAFIRTSQTTFYPYSENTTPTKLHWTALFIDEAAQATEPETLIPISVVTPPIEFACTSSPILAMAGDQHQLGPRTYSRSITTLHISLFERLLNLPLYADHPLARRYTFKRKDVQAPDTTFINPPFADLKLNYRSHAAILAVPSSLFYDDCLTPEATDVDGLASYHGWQGRKWPILFICNSRTEECLDIRSPLGSGWHNVDEAKITLTYAIALLEGVTGLMQEEICIMSPFKAQVNNLRMLARSKGYHGLNIGPVEAFQGLESRVVIICTTRTSSRFLEQDALRGVGIVNEPKKFNVALTRAKQGLIVIGNPKLLEVDPYWGCFLGFCWRNGLWVSEQAAREAIHEPFGDGGDTDDWIPSEEVREQVSKSENALIYGESVRNAVPDPRSVFLRNILDDEMWIRGVEAEQQLFEEDAEGEADVDVEDETEDQDDTDIEDEADIKDETDIKHESDSEDP